MLRLGVFCGKHMTDRQIEFRKSRFKNARLAKNGRDPSLNYFGVDASQPLSVWRRNGWIHPDDLATTFDVLQRIEQSADPMSEQHSLPRSFRHAAELFPDPPCRPRLRLQDLYRRDAGPARRAVARSAAAL